VGSQRLTAELRHGLCRRSDPGFMTEIKLEELQRGYTGLFYKNRNVYFPNINLELIEQMKRQRVNIRKTGVKSEIKI
jgi:hypothetical protein